MNYLNPHTHPLDQDVESVDRTGAVLFEVSRERGRQDARWGQQNHDDHPATGHSLRASFTEAAEDWKTRNADRVRRLNAEGAPSDRNCYWDGILLEEVFEAVSEKDPARIRAELIQVAAVAVAWVESIDRRAGGTR